MSEETAYLPQFNRTFVATDDGLRAILPALEAESVVAVDIEMGQRVSRKPGGVQEWVHILALIQIAAGSTSVIIDPLRCSVTPLKRLMGGPARKVFLGGGQDAALLAKAGIPPRTIVDVGEVAYALYGRREDGMAALARRIFDVSLDKTVRRADWMIRPINPTLLSYAYMDAELTLGIYYWMARHHRDIIHFHQRRELDPVVPDAAPAWLRDALGKSSSDALAIVMEHGIAPESDEERLSADLRPFLTSIEAPRMLNRLLRIAGDLRLRSLLPDILLIAESPSSLLRASAARAIGLTAEPDEGQSVLDRLAADPIEDVRKAAIAGIRDMAAAGETPDLEEDIAEAATSLGDDAMSALMRLKLQLEGKSE